MLSTSLCGAAVYLGCIITGDVVTIDALGHMQVGLGWKLFWSACAEPKALRCDRPPWLSPPHGLRGNLIRCFVG